MNISSVAQSYVMHSYASPTVREQTQEPDDSQPQKETDAALSPEELKEVEKLKARDREVRAHEMAHLAAAGGLATSGASFTYQRGPDGASYAIGGEVQIDTSKGSNPEETLRKARTIRAAALAPAEPSGQDRAVAAKATQMETQARAEQAAQDREERSEDADTADPNSANQKAAQHYQDVANYSDSPQFELQA